MDPLTIAKTGCQVLQAAIGSVVISGTSVYNAKKARESNEKIAKDNREYLAKVQREIAERHDKNTREIAEMQIQSTLELAKYNALESRNTMIMSALLNAEMSLRNSVFLEHLHSFPLNISPFIILENNGYKLEQFLSDTHVEHKIDHLVKNPLPVNIIIAPLQINTNQLKSEIQQQVWNKIYGSLESFFTREYARTSCRPVSLYNAAWNVNVKPGNHAAEILYLFLKNLPTIVIEPRLDQGKIRFFISSWSLGFMAPRFNRHEISIPFCMDSLILESTYSRSLDTYNFLSNLEKTPSKLALHLENCKKNIDLFNEIKKHEKNPADYLLFFNISPEDCEKVANDIASGLSIVLAAFSDVHHLLTTTCDPHLPEFWRDLQSPGKFPDDLSDTILKIYGDCYLYLKREFSKLEPLFTAKYTKIHGALKGKKDDIKYGLMNSLQQYCIQCNNYQIQPDDLDALLKFFSNNVNSDDFAYFETIREFCQFLPGIEKYLRKASERIYPPKN